MLYEREPYLIVDIPRATTKERDSHPIPYDLFENYKDDGVTQEKYKVQKKRTGQLNRIVIFSNEMPDISKLTTDRWDIRLLNAYDEGGVLLADPTKPKLNAQRKLIKRVIKTLPVQHDQAMLLAACGLRIDQSTNTVVAIDH